MWSLPHISGESLAGKELSDYRPGVEKQKVGSVRRVDKSPPRENGIPMEHALFAYAFSFTPTEGIGEAGLGDSSPTNSWPPIGFAHDLFDMQVFACIH